MGEKAIEPDRLIGMRQIMDDVGVLRPDGDLLAEIEARYRSLRLIGDDQ